MDRLACVSLPALPLQLLLRRHPEWVICPVAVVAEDRPQGLICYVNAAARKTGVRPGLRYAAGCSLTADLRAGVVSPAEIDEATEAIMERLRRFTPEVEPSTEKPGVFWLNGSGLTRLYPSHEVWAKLIVADLNSADFRATVVVGFTRFGTYAVAMAKSREEIVICKSFADERTAARRVRLECLELDSDLRDTFVKLGVTTVDAFLALPAGGLLTRFGEAAYRLHRMASGDLWMPLQPQKPQEPIRQRLLLDDPETDAMRLLFRLKGLLHPLLKTLAVRGEALVELTLRLQLDLSASQAGGGIWREEHLCLAAPTLDPTQILDLIRLRLDAVELPTGVIEIDLQAVSIPALAEQYRLTCLCQHLPARQQAGGRQVVERPRRDLEAANRALARIRATFGDKAIGRVRLVDAHLPEASFRWEPLNQGLGVRDQGSGPESAIRNPQSETAKRSLVRRIFAKPVPLRLPPGSTLHGPYIVSGGWWGRDLSAPACRLPVRCTQTDVRDADRCGPVCRPPAAARAGAGTGRDAQAGTHREYYFAETRHGELLWVYHDPNRCCWFLHGMVE